MPTYSYSCACGKKLDIIRSMAERRRVVRCPACHECMLFEEVYSFATNQNEASSWPYESDNLVPRDPKLFKRYQRAGRITPEGRVRIADPADHRRVCREQGVRLVGDYEKTGTSLAKGGRRFRREAAEKSRLSAIEKAAGALREGGISLG